MLYFFKFLLLLIDINQKTLFNWFGMESSEPSKLAKILRDHTDRLILNNNVSVDISMKTIQLIVQGLWEKVQDGLTLSDIESALFFILFIRFIILTIRYNSKTSLYITCISLFAGYLWYRHLIDLVSMYRSILLRLPLVHRMGEDGLELRGINQQITMSTSKMGENAHWYNPGQVLYYALTKGIINIDTETGFKYYIDPISMFISNLNESDKSIVLPIYYKLYNEIIPKVYEICSKFWSQLSGVAAYAIITRIGKRYCPYLVRWHWTCLLIMGMVEPTFTYFIFRIYYFQTYILNSQIEELNNHLDNNSLSLVTNLLFQINILNLIMSSIILIHLGFVLFGLFHAIWGQYFYIPFVVDNIELHIGLRPKRSIYSGGKTAWQNKYERRKTFYPKLWYGWFGSGTESKVSIFDYFKYFIQRYFKKILKKIKRQLKKIKKK